MKPKATGSYQIAISCHTAIGKVLKMPVISFANPKGGAGKSTSALILATQLAEHGGTVAVIDADPEQWIKQWAALAPPPVGLSVVSCTSSEQIVEAIAGAAQRAQFVIVDLEGTASLLVAQAIGMSDLVLIPLQASTMDAKGAAKTLKLIRNQSVMLRRPIRHSVVFTRTNAAILTRSMKNVRLQLSEAKVDVLETAIVERAAFRDLFDFGGGLSNLDPDLVSNLAKAKENARQFAGEVVWSLRKTEEIA